MPAFLKVKLICRLARLLLNRQPFVVLVTVCGASLRFTHVTRVPTLIVVDVGLKMKDCPFDLAAMVLPARLLLVDVLVGTTVGVAVAVGERVTVGVAVGDGTTAGTPGMVGTGVAVGGRGVGPPLPCTMTVPVIKGWMAQWYVNVPAVEKVNENDCPWLSEPEFQETADAASLLVVCEALSWFVQTTVVPTGMVTVSGPKAKF